MDLVDRYRLALVRIMGETPFMKKTESGINSIECKTRRLYVDRILNTTNRIDAIEKGVIAEMSAQDLSTPQQMETMLGDVPADERE